MLAAWLSAYLAAPDSAGKVSFTANDLLDSAGLTASYNNLAALANALPRAGLEPGFCLDTWQRAWFRPLPWPPLPLDEMAAHARDVVQETAERASTRHWAFYREGSLDILGRLDRAIAIHRRQAGYALDWACAGGCP